MSPREPAQWMRTIQVALPAPYADDGAVAADVRAGRDFGGARPPLRDPTPAEEREIATSLEPIFAAEDAALRIAA